MSRIFVGKLEDGSDSPQQWNAIVPWRFYSESYEGDEKLKEDIFQRILDAISKLNSRLSYDNCLTFVNLNDENPNPNPYNWYAKVLGNVSASNSSCYAHLGMSANNIFENETMQWHGMNLTFHEWAGRKYYGINS